MYIKIFIFSIFLFSALPVFAGIDDNFDVGNLNCYILDTNRNLFCKHNESTRQYLRASYSVDGEVWTNATLLLNAGYTDYTFVTQFPVGTKYFDVISDDPIQNYYPSTIPEGENPIVISFFSSDSTVFQIVRNMYESNDIFIVLTEYLKNLIVYIPGLIVVLAIIIIIYKIPFFIRKYLS